MNTALAIDNANPSVVATPATGDVKAEVISIHHYLFEGGCFSAMSGFGLEALPTFVEAQDQQVAVGQISPLSGQQTAYFSELMIAELQPVLAIEL